MHQASTLSYTDSTCTKGVRSSSLPLDKCKLGLAVAAGNAADGRLPGRGAAVSCDEPDSSSIG